MKIEFFKGVIFLMFIFLANTAVAQDIITLKNGDEIKSKVIEVAPDLVKYKKWDNLEGPTYSSNKSEVFMIKYINGTKEVFNQSSTSVNQSTQNLSNDDKKNEAFETLNRFFRNRFNKDKVFIMLDLVKSNGVMKNINGQSIYEIDYKLKLKFISDAWVKSFYGRVYFDKNFTTYDKEPTLDVFGTTTSNAHLFKKGKIYIFSGTATMENTDNGYILKDYDIKKVDYMGMDSEYNSQSSIQKYPISGNDANPSYTPTINKREIIPVNDIEGNVYKAVTINNQVWMIENLKTTKYNDGTNIPYVMSDFEWKNLKTPGYCWPSNDSTNRSKYGALYNWYTVNTNILCPTGWHVPTDTELTLMTSNNGDKIFAAGELSGFRSNTSDFSSDIGRLGIWWSSTENTAVAAWVRFLNKGYTVLGRHGEYNKGTGFSVRCLKDN